MKALVYTQPRKVEYLDWPDRQLALGDALVRIGAVSLCGSDVHGWLGHSRGRVPPLVLGHEMAGVVERVEGDAPVEPGQPVGPTRLSVATAARIARRTRNTSAAASECWGCTRRAVAHSS